MSDKTEYDLTPKANLVIWGYFLLFAILLYVTLTGLNIYFRAEVEREQYVKVGSVKSKDLIEQRQNEEEALKNINEAMEKVVREAR